MTGRASGSIFGLAYGDALGKPTEFLDMRRIVKRYGPDGPRELEGAPALVTDDTQMALAVGEGLVYALTHPPFTPDLVAPIWRRKFVDWARSPDNNRAPGNTCMRAIAGLAEGHPWVKATIQGSKGCGANMRVTPVGLVPGLTGEERSGAAQLQAALTHGHPTGLAASELTAYVVWWLREGMAPTELQSALREHCRSQRTTYHERWLGELWQRPGVSTPAEFIARGWDECLEVLDRLDAALPVADRNADPCLATGGGWIAEEALATALLCFLMFPDDPVAAIWRGAASSGDSDSIACLAGAFAGAYLGMDAWPAEWATRIEYADRLTRLGRAFD